MFFYESTTYLTVLSTPNRDLKLSDSISSFWKIKCAIEDCILNITAAPLGNTLTHVSKTTLNFFMLSANFVLLR